MVTKVKALFLGMTFVIVILELALRVTGFVEVSGEVLFDSKIDKSKNIVLCVGNSFTRGHGAPSEESYPSHLQKLLNNHYGDKKFQVLNLGRSGWNTHQILANIDSFIQQTNPVLIILRGGGPNEFNLTGAPFLSFSKDYIWYFISDKIRVVRYFRQILHDFRKRDASAIVPGKEEEHIFKKRLDFIRMNEWFDKCYDENTFVACSDGRKDFKKIQDVIKVYQELLKHAPNDFLYYIKLSAIHLEFEDNISKALDVIFKGLDRVLKIENRLNRQYWKQYFYYRLINIKSFVSPDNKSFDRMMKSISLLEPAVPFHERIMKKYDDNKIASWIVSDLDKILSITRRRNVKVIMHNYPPIPIGKTYGKRTVNSLLSIYAQKNNIPFLDFEKVMMDMFVNGEDLSTHYYQFNDKLDFHLNSSGYELNARELLKIIDDVDLP